MHARPDTRISDSGHCRNLLAGLPLILCLILAAVPSISSAGSAYDLEAIVNRALQANWGTLDAREGVERAGLRLEAAESEFELRIVPFAAFGLFGGDERGTDADFNLGVSLEKKTQYGTRLTLAPSIESVDDRYRGRTFLSLTQPLLRGAGRDYAMSGVFVARFGERTSMRSQALNEVDTVLGAVSRGYEVVRQREILRLRRESHQRLSDLAEATAIKERMGLVTAMDLYRVHIQRNQAGEELLQSRETHVDALDSLKIFLALPPEQPIDVHLPLEFDRVRPDEHEMIQTALANRLELVQARETLAMARHLSGTARRDALPELDVRLFFSQAGDPSSGFPGAMTDQTTWGISIGSATDLRRTARKARYEESLLDIARAARGQYIVRDEVVAQVKREIRNLDRLDKAMINQEEQVHHSRGQLELARVKFEHGLADNFDLIDAETSLRRSQTQLVSALIDYIVGQYRLRAVIGTLVHRCAAGVYPRDIGQRSPAPPQNPG